MPCREMVHLVGLSIPSLVSYPEVRQLLAEVADPRVVGSVLSDAAASARTNQNSEVLRSSVDVASLQAQLLARLQADYKQALKHPTLQPFIGHEQQWAMASSFTPEGYR